MSELWRVVIKDRKNKVILHDAKYSRGQTFMIPEGYQLVSHRSNEELKEDWYEVEPFKTEVTDGISKEKI